MWVCPRCFRQIWQLGNGYPWLSGLSATHQQTPHDVYHLFNHLGPCVWAPLPLLGSKFGHSQVCGVSMNWPLSSVMAKHNRWSCFRGYGAGLVGHCQLQCPCDLDSTHFGHWNSSSQTWINLDSEARILDDFSYILGSSDIFAAVIQFACILLVQPLILYLLLGVMADVQNLEKQFKEFSIQKSQCFCCTSDHRHPDTGETLMCDRKFVYEAVRTWYAAGLMETMEIQYILRNLTKSCEPACVAASWKVLKPCSFPSKSCFAWQLWIKHQLLFRWWHGQRLICCGMVFLQCLKQVSRDLFGG